jgi:hypothetical protein
MYLKKHLLRIKFTYLLLIYQIIIIFLIYIDIIYSHSKNKYNKKRNDNNINEILRFKTYDYISPLGSYNQEIGLSTFMEANIIKIYFTLLIPSLDGNFLIKNKNENFNEDKILLNTKEELIYLGIDEKNISINKRMNQNQDNFFFRLKEEFNHNNFSTSSFNFRNSFSFVDFKIIVYNLNTLSKIEKFINVNKNYLYDKVIFYGFEKEITNKKIKKLEKIIIKKAKDNLDKFFIKNKLKKGNLINRKIIIDKNSDYFVYGNSKEKKLYSKNPQLKILNILLELNYEISEN